MSAILSERRTSALCLIGKPDRHQRRFVKWVKHVSPETEVYQAETAQQTFFNLSRIPDSKTSTVVVFHRELPRDEEIVRQFSQDAEKLLQDFARKGIICQTRSGEPGDAPTISEIFRRPERTEYAFILPACPLRRPTSYYRGAISYYVYALAYSVLVPTQMDGMDSFEVLRRNPQGWKDWITQLSTKFKATRTGHSPADLFSGLYHQLARLASGP